MSESFVVDMVGLDASFPEDIKGNKRNHGGDLSVMIDQMLEAGRDEVEALGFRATIKHYYLHEIVRPYSGAYNFEPDYIKPLFNRLRTCHVIFSGAQTNWFGPSSNWQMFIEHATALENKKFQLAGKVAGLASTCHEAGGDSVLKAMWLPLTFMGLMTPPFAGVYKVKEGLGGEDRWQYEEPVLIAQNSARLALITNGHWIDHNNWRFRKGTSTYSPKV